MKKLIVFISLILLGVTGYFAVNGRNEVPIQTASVQSEITQTEEQTSIPQDTPQRLVINAIGVDAAVESVGMDSQGRMDVPKEDENVAWYNLGFHPGERGSAVLAGHFDSRTGGPAVFYELSQLQEGDELTVSYANGTTFTFVVTGSEEYDFDKVPLQEIFNSKDQPRLNLITCDGVFDKSSRNYSKRLVVYSVLKS